jgi:putative membrane protein
LELSRLPGKIENSGGSVDVPVDQEKGIDVQSKNGDRRIRYRRMGPNPYERFLNSEMILRDQLAIDRTVLANERTLLAYIRTVLALVLAGATVIRIFEDPSLNILGWTLIAFGVFVGGIGFWRTLRISRRVRSAMNEPPKSDGESRAD